MRGVPFLCDGKGVILLGIFHDDVPRVNEARNLFLRLAWVPRNVRDK